MKFSSPTARKTFKRCSKRFWFRYRHAPSDPVELSEHRQRRHLFGIRELGGHLIHAKIAEMVHAIGACEPWDGVQAVSDCQHDFLLIVAKSMSVRRGELIGEKQIAETYNGAGPAEIKEEIMHWRDLIPIALENAFRAAHTLEIGHESSIYQIETEKEVVWRSGGQTYNGVIDVLIRTPHRAIVVDWKCHQIDNTDLFQVRGYMDSLRTAHGIPVSALFGFAVDLLHEEVIRVKYDPFGLARSNSASGHRHLMGPEPTVKTDPFAASPDYELCLRCPYASHCPDSALRPVPQTSLLV